MHRGGCSVKKRMVALYGYVTILQEVDTRLYDSFKASLNVSNDSMKKIAFLFLIYDSIHHEEIWNHYFMNVDPNKYTIYVHYKRNTPLLYFEKYKLQHCIETEYAHISIVYAQNLLLKTALKDEDNAHFIFLSQSCIPLQSFHTLYHSLNPTVSYFNVAPHHTCFPAYSTLLTYFSKDTIQKASQWCILNRKHSTLLVNDECYFRLYVTVPAPDEAVYITTLHLHQMQQELVVTQNIACHATTFTNWKDMDHPYPSENGLKIYSEISKDELFCLLQSKSFFARKFNKECDLLSHPFYLTHIM